MGFFWLELVPSPNSHSQAVGSPVETSVKVRVSAQAEAPATVKSAMGATAQADRQVRLFLWATILDTVEASHWSFEPVMEGFMIQAEFEMWGALKLCPSSCAASIIMLREVAVK